VTSETGFALHHTSTWRTLAPTIDLLVREVNLELYRREFPIMKSAVAAHRRGLINEIAFNVFCSSLALDDTLIWSDNIVSGAVRHASRKIAALDKIPIEQVNPPNEIELNDCIQQVKRLRAFFLDVRDTIEVLPKFPGAGFIETCEGDVYSDGTLFEIKAGHRPYKSVDFKQLLTYAALNYASASRPLDRIGLFNPRMGTSFVAGLDVIAAEISGCSSVELLQEIIRVISSGDVSR
jgi:hypothetical protein